MVTLVQFCSSCRSTKKFSFMSSSLVFRQILKSVRKSNSSSFGIRLFTYDVHTFSTWSNCSGRYLHESLWKSFTSCFPCTFERWKNKPSLPWIWLQNGVIHVLNSVWLFTSITWPISSNLPTPVFITTVSFDRPRRWGKKIFS